MSARKRQSEYKVTVLGCGGVGKTAFTIQMCSHHFVESYDPTLEASYRVQVVVGDRACVLDILDTAGQEEYSCLRSQWMRSGEGFLLLFSITDPDSFLHADTFRTDILHTKDTEILPPLVLVGNKADLSEQRKVPKSEAEELAALWQVPYLEASAKTRTNVEEAFFMVVRRIWEEEDQATNTGGGQSASPSRGKKSTFHLKARCVLF